MDTTELEKMTHKIRESMIRLHETAVNSETIDQRTWEIWAAVRTAKHPLNSAKYCKLIRTEIERAIGPVVKRAEELAVELDKRKTKIATLEKRLKSADEIHRAEVKTIKAKHDAQTKKGAARARELESKVRDIKNELTLLRRVHEAELAAVKQTEDAI